MSTAFGQIGQDSPNTVDFDLSRIISCDIFDQDDPLTVLVCNQLLPMLLDQLVQSEDFCDQVFVGYRDDMPRFLRNQLDEPVIISVFIGRIDGPGGTLARAGPIGGFDLDGDGVIDVPGIINFLPNPFLRNFRNYRAWSIPRFSTMEIDLDDIPGLVLTEGMVDTAVHETLHAMGHPTNFLISRLNRPLNFFGQVNFLGDRTGINDVGYGLTEFRQESGNPFATYVPLSQEADPNARAGHLSMFEPTFFDFDENLQEVFIPIEFGLVNYMSRTLRGMFADMGYKIQGINTLGFIDIDGDGIEDMPLIVNPTLPTDPQSGLGGF